MRVLVFLLLSCVCQAAIPTATFLKTQRLSFEENRGQYLARGHHYSLALAPDGNQLTIFDRTRRKRAVVRTRIAGADPGVRLKALEPLAGRSNYFLGRDADRWVTGVPQYGRVRYGQVYRGIDLVFHGSSGELEYDFIVAPGADPGAIRLLIEGSQPISISAEGDLVLSTAAGEVRWKRPIIYQDGAVRTAVAGRFVHRGRNGVGFAIAKYDRTRALVIDPTLSFSTYFGAEGDELARGIGVDAAGNVYIAGYTTSQELPVKNALQPGFGGRTSISTGPVGDGFVAKFSPAGANLYTTYLGGSRDDVIVALAVDPAGNVYVGGSTNSANFPVTANAVQRGFGGDGGQDLVRLGDGFLAKLNPDGKLLYSTYLGGRFDDTVLAITLDTDGNAYLAGTTLSDNFPVTEGAYQVEPRGAAGQPTFPRLGTPLLVSGDVFVTKINPESPKPVFSTLLGGKLDDSPSSIALDGAGNVYVAGFTLSSDFPTTPGAYQTTHKGMDMLNRYFNFGDGFVAKFDPSGRRLLFSTLLGGTGDDEVTALAVDASGNIFVTGCTSSKDFPVTTGVFQRLYAGPTGLPPLIDQIFGDAFVVKLNPAGSGLLFSTYLGGRGDEFSTAIALDALGNIFVAGITSSRDFPVSQDAVQPQFGGVGGQTNQPIGDGFVAQLSPDGTSRLYGTYLGGSQDDLIAGMVLDKSGNVYVTGNTFSRNFPTTAGAFQRTYGGAEFSNYTLKGRFGGDAFAAKISGFSITPPPPPPAEPAPKVSAVVNGASRLAGPVAPGMVFVATGSTLGPRERASAGVDRATGLQETSKADTRFLFDGTPAPLLYVSEGETAGMVPYAVDGKTSALLVVEYKGQKSPPLTLAATAATPGLFSRDSSGAGQAEVANEDGSLNSADNPALAGSVIMLIGTGAGQTDPAGVDGKIAGDDPSVPRLPVSATIGGQDAEVVYIGAVGGQPAGFFQIQLRVPEGVEAGDQAVAVTVGSFSSQPNLTVAAAPLPSESSVVGHRSRARKD